MAAVVLPDGRNAVTVATSKTLAVTDAGTVQKATGAAVVFTLPAAAAGNVGLTFTIVNGGVPKTGTPVGTGDNTSGGFSVEPNSADGIEGLGFTSTVNTGLINTKATALVYDELEVICSGVTGVHAWHVVKSRGIFAQG